MDIEFDEISDDIDERRTGAIRCTQTIRPTIPKDMTAIKRHFAEDKVRRVAIRNGLALAKALGRTFVFPPPRCYCDKIWNTLKGVARSVRKTHLPFACPMDHLYDLSGMFELDIDFREAGFLEDERLDARIREDVVRVQIGGANEDENSRETADQVLNRRFRRSSSHRSLRFFLQSLSHHVRTLGRRFVLRIRRCRRRQGIRSSGERGALSQPIFLLKKCTTNKASRGAVVQVVAVRASRG